MNLDEKKEELRFAHKLEKKRIRLNRGLAALTIVIAGGLAYYVAPRFAQEFRLAEFKRQKYLEVEKLWENHFINNTLNGYKITAQLEHELYNKFRGAAYHFGKDTPNQNRNESRDEINRLALNLVDALDEYAIYFEYDYYQLTRARAALYVGAIQSPANEWQQYGNFFSDLRDHVLALRRATLVQQMRGSQSKTMKEFWEPVPYGATLDSTYTIGKIYYEAYFLANYDSYKSHMKAP